MRQLDDVAIVKVPAAREYSAQQNGRIDRRYFRVPDSLPGIDVGKVIVESAMRWQRSPKEGERCYHPQARVLVGNEPALFGNAYRRQAKAGRGNAGHDTCIRGACVAAVFNQAGLRARLLPEEEEVAPFKVVQELLFFRREGRLRRRGFLMLLISRSGPGLLRQPSNIHPRGERQTHGDAGHLPQQPAPGSEMLARVDHRAKMWCAPFVRFIHAPSGLAHRTNSLRQWNRLIE